MKRIQYIYRVSLLLGVLVLSACAGTGQSNNIDARAQARWDTLLSGDLAGAYEYLSPGQRSAISSLDYQRDLLMTPVRWTGAVVGGSECSEDACTVQVDLDFMVVGALPGIRKFESSKVITENWIRVNGQWWYVPKS
jgi:hypothetical protein